MEVKKQKKEHEDNYNKIRLICPKCKSGNIYKRKIKQPI